MTTDTPGFSGDIISGKQPRLEGALAPSNLQHAEGVAPASGLRLVDTGSQNDPSPYYDALEVLTQSVPKAAAFKNVPVQPQFHTDIAREAIRLMTNEEMAGLLALDPVAVKKAQVALSHALDVLAATMIANFVAHIRGFDDPAPWLIARIVDAHIESIQGEGLMVKWPDLLETALKYARAAEAVDG